MAKNWLDWVALVLVIVGGLNWGLYALGYNLVELLSFGYSYIANTVYALVAISALYLIYYAIKE